MTSESFAIGESTGVAAKLSLGAARQDINARYGGGYYGVAAGLALSAGAGLTLNISSGHIMIDGVQEIPTGTSVGLTDGGRNWIWMSRVGAVVVVFNSLVPPAGAYALLGSALTAAGAISSVDQSGVIVGQGGIPFRRTADPDMPGDTPPAGFQFTQHSVNSTWTWDGLRYSAGVQLPVSIANGGTGATTAAIARDNLGAGPQSQLVKQPSASFVFTAAEVNAASEIELRSGGGVAAAFTATLPSTAHTPGDPTSGVVPGAVWSLSNTTGFTCSLLVNGRTALVLIPTGGRVSVCYDGTDAIPQSSRSRSALVIPTDANFTPVSPTQLADILEVASAGALTGTRDVILGAPVDRTWFAYNGTTGGQAIRLIFTSGTGVTIANARGAWVYGNSTNLLRMTPDSVNT